jgi:GNAT superfamily N-acetyltransferase
VSNTPRYPDAADLLDKHIKRSKTSNRVLAIEIGEKEQPRSATAISNYRKGLAKPGKREEEKVIERLSNYFFPTSKEGAAKKKFSVDLKRFWAAPTLTGNMLADLGAGLRELTVTHCNYPPFAGPGSKLLFQGFCDRLFDQAGIQLKPPTVASTCKEISDAKSDVVYAIFDSVDRMLRLNLKFWRFPIRVGLGAVCSIRDEAHCPDIVRALSQPSSKQLGSEPKLHIRAIVATDEVGAVHCRHRLKLQDIIDIDRTDLPKELASRLKDENREGTRGDAIPVVCVDELTAFRVLQLMGAEGCSVFPMNSLRASEKDDLRRELPQFYASLAASRNTPPDFQTFITDALVQFLSTEVETTAELWFETAKLLYEEIKFVAPRANERFGHKGLIPRLEDAQRWRDTWAWVLYTLNLNPRLIAAYSDGGLPWKPILERALQRLQKEYFALEGAKISNLVEMLFASRPYATGTSPTDRELQELGFQIERLSEFFGIKLAPQDRLPLQYLDAPAVLAGRIISALIGQQIQPDFGISYMEHNLSDESSTLVPEHLSVLLGELQKVYGSLPNKEGAGIARAMENDIRDMSNRHSVNPGRIITASDGKKLVGMICVTGLNRDRCQLKYLYVDDAYRGRWVGSGLIDRAIRVAEAFKCHMANTEIFPSFGGAIRLFLKKKFMFDRPVSTLGRATLVREIKSVPTEGDAPGA